MRCAYGRRWQRVCRRTDVDHDVTRRLLALWQIVAAPYRDGPDAIAHDEQLLNHINHQQAGAFEG